MLDWVKKKLGIDRLENDFATIREDLNQHRSFVHSKVEELKDYTRVDADVGFRGNNTIILTGVYKNRAYVKFYDLPPGLFERMVDELKYMRQHALIRHIDSPPSFHGTFDLLEGDYE
jgi:hypothetical protein